MSLASSALFDYLQIYYGLSFFGMIGDNSILKRVEERLDNRERRRELLSVSSYFLDFPLQEHETFSRSLVAKLKLGMPFTKSDEEEINLKLSQIPIMQTCYY